MEMCCIGFECFLCFQQRDFFLLIFLQIKMKQIYFIKQIYNVRFTFVFFLLIFFLTTKLELKKK